MDKDELINGYFEGSLSENQSAELERLRQTDTAFAATFEFERELQSALRKDERQEIKSMFSQLDSETEDSSSRSTVGETETVANSGDPTLGDTEMTDQTDIETEDGKPESTQTITGDLKHDMPKKSAVKVISIRPWLVAASIVLLLGLGSWLLFFNSPDLNTDQLYAANFVPYENVVYPIERGEQLEDLKTRAFTAYEDADYLLSLDLFKELQIQQADPYIAFYEAIVLMQLNKHQEAIPLLEGYIENDGQLKDRATWYLALAYLKQNEVAESKAQLEKLIEMGSFKKEAAQELLEELDSEL